MPVFLFSFSARLEFASLAVQKLVHQFIFVQYFVLRYHTHGKQKRGAQPVHLGHSDRNGAARKRRLAAIAVIGTHGR